MNNGRLLDRALLLAILAAMGGLYWHMFSMNERFAVDIARLSSDIAEVSQQLSGDIAELNVRLSGDIADLNVRLSGDIAELSERLGRVETHLEYLVPRPAGPTPARSPGG